MTSSFSEHAVVDNQFGIVTNKRVIYMTSKGWFSGGYREDVPLSQVVSIRYQVERNILGGFLFIIGGLFSISSGVRFFFSPGDIPYPVNFSTMLLIVALFVVAGFVAIILGLLFLWGSPEINVITSGGTHSTSSGWPWQRFEAEEFVTALRDQIFTNAP